MERKDTPKASEMRKDILKIEDGIIYYKNGMRMRVEKGSSTEVTPEKLEK